MPTFFSQFSRRNFLTYLLIISALASYAAHLHFEKKKQMALNLGFDRTLKQACDVISNGNEKYLMSIDRQVKNYPSPKSQLLFQQSKTVEKMGDAFQKTLQHERDRIYQETEKGLPKPSQSLLAERQKSLSQKLNLLADSLYFFAKKDSQITTRLEKLISKERLAATKKVLFFENNDQAQVFLAILNLKTTLASRQILQFLEKKTVDEDLKADQFLPGIDLRKTCIRAGEFLEGEVFAVGYISKIDNNNIEMLVNGKIIPVENGIGKYHHVYKTPGLKKLEAQIRLKNPASGRFEHVSKKFEIQVCE